jgi:branched-chain amino acid transport system substrate-binding protein
MSPQLYIQPVRILTGILFLSLWGLVACQTPSTPEPTAVPTEIRIGLLAPFSGPNAATAGQATLNSANLAIAEINEAGGLLVGGRHYLVELVPEDDGGTRETAVAAAQRLINQENVVAIIGPPYSGTTLAVAPIANEARIPLITPTATNPDITPGLPYVFRATFDDTFQAIALAHFISQGLAANHVAVLYDVSNDYSRGLAETFHHAFSERQGEIVAFETYTADTSDDFTGQLERIAQSQAEVLFLPNFTDHVLRQGQQAKAMGLNLTFIGGDSWNGERLSAQGDFVGAFFSGNYCRDLSNETIRRFVEKFETTYGQVPDGMVALTYDAFGLLFAAIEAENSFEPDNIKDGLYNISYNGITGTITFDPNGNPDNKSVPIWKIEETTRACYTEVSPGS